MPESKPHSRADLIDNARGLAGLGLDKGYDELLYALSDELERLEEQFESLRREALKVVEVESAGVLPDFQPLADVLGFNPASRAEA